MRPADCVHLLAPVEPPGRRTDAAGVVCHCRGTWVHGCDRHGSCTVGVPRLDAACCQTCPDYDPAAAPAAAPQE